MIINLKYFFDKIIIIRWNMYPYLFYKNILNLVPWNEHMEVRKHTHTCACTHTHTHTEAWTDTNSHLNIYGSAPAFPNRWGCGSTFNLLIVLLGWLCQWIAQSICLPAHVVFLIQAANQSLIRVTGRWVDGWDRTIKNFLKSRTPTNSEQDTACNYNNI